MNEPDLKYPWLGKIVAVVLVLGVLLLFILGQIRVNKVSSDNKALKAYVNKAIAAAKAGLPIPPPPRGVELIQGTPGVKGDKGDTGDTGVTGPQGPAGPPGSNPPCLNTVTTTPPGGVCAGVSGASGASGTNGANGAAGTVPAHQTRVEHFPDGSVLTCTTNDSAATWDCTQTTPPTTTTTSVPPTTTTTVPCITPGVPKGCV